MKENALVVALALVAMSAVGGFTSSAVVVFGASCAVVAAGVVMRRALVSVAGMFALGLLSPFAFEYPTISDGFTLTAVTALVTLSVCGLMHVSLTADERRRFEWRVRWPAVLVTLVAILAVVYSVVLISGIEAVGTFLGNLESTGAQVIILACATAFVLALLLIPKPDGAGGQ